MQIVIPKSCIGCDEASNELRARQRDVMIRCWWLNQRERQFRMKFADIKRFWEIRLGSSGNNASSRNMRVSPKLQQSTKFSKRKKSKASPKAHRVNRGELFSSSDEAMSRCSDVPNGGNAVSVSKRQDHRTDVTSANSTIRNNSCSNCESDEDTLHDESHSRGHHVSNSFAFSFLHRIKKSSRNVGRQQLASAASGSVNERRKSRSNSASYRNMYSAGNAVESNPKQDAREDNASGFWSLKKKKRSYRTTDAPACTKPEATNDYLSRTNLESKTARFGIDQTEDTNQIVPISLQRGKSLAERSRTKIRARRTGGKQSPASAPSSLRSSPSHGQRKTVELEKLWRRLPDMNEKFNQIQNFWQMKEKRSVAQFAKERRWVLVPLGYEEIGGLNKRFAFCFSLGLYWLAPKKSPFCVMQHNAFLSQCLGCKSV